MRSLTLALTLLIAPLAIAVEDGFISLWDGKTFGGWKASENKGTFTIKDGALVAQGKRSHLFYVGDVNGGKFKNFELKVDVKAQENSNGGIYFHTQYQEVGWPDHGFEVQVNNTHKDRRKTGGLYAVADVMDTPPAKDYEWFTEHIIVKGNHVVIKVDGKTTADWTQPEGWQGAHNMPLRKIRNGTIALQGHDPVSVVHFKNIRIKPRP